MRENLEIMKNQVKRKHWKYVCKRDVQTEPRSCPYLTDLTCFGPVLTLAWGVLHSVIDSTTWLQKEEIMMVIMMTLTMMMTMTIMIEMMMILTTSSNV